MRGSLGRASDTSGGGGHSDAFGSPQPHERRITSAEGNCFSRSRREPTTRSESSSTRSTAARAIAGRSEKTVVSGGSVSPASFTSSKPATASSPGTSMRSSRAARSTPMAWSSVAQKIAGGRSGPASSPSAT